MLVKNDADAPYPPYWGSLNLVGGCSMGKGRAPLNFGADPNHGVEAQVIFHFQWVGVAGWLIFWLFNGGYALSTKEHTHASAQPCKKVPNCRI